MSNNIHEKVIQADKQDGWAGQAEQAFGTDQRDKPEPAWNFAVELPETSILREHQAKGEEKTNQWACKQ